MDYLRISPSFWDKFKYGVWGGVKAIFPFNSGNNHCAGFLLKYFSSIIGIIVIVKELQRLFDIESTTESKIIVTWVKDL